MTHPYPALPLTNQQRHPERYRHHTWTDLLLDGCPKCGCTYFQEWAECLAIWDIEILADYDPDLDMTFAGKIEGRWTTHGDSDNPSLHCGACGLELDADMGEISYS